MDPVEDESPSTPEIFETPNLVDVYASSSSSPLNVEPSLGANEAQESPEEERSLNTPPNIELLDDSSTRPPLSDRNAKPEATDNSQMDLDPVEDESPSTPEIIETPNLVDIYASSSSSPLNVEPLGASEAQKSPEEERSLNTPPNIELLDDSSTRPPLFVRNARPEATGNSQMDLDAESSVSDDIPSCILQYNIENLLEKLGNDKMQYGSDFKSLMLKLQSNIETLLGKLGNDKYQYGSMIYLSQTDFKSLMSSHLMANHSIIDAYLTLISNRSKEKEFPTVYCFNTEFGVSLLENGPNEVIIGNLRHLNLFSYNFLLVPFWCIDYWMMFLVDNVQRKIMFYDIGRTNGLAIESLQNLLTLYHKRYVENYKRGDSKKFNSPFKSYLIERETAKRLNIPAATSLNDTDVLVLVFAEIISKSPVTTRNYKNIDCEYHRSKITYELLTSKLLSQDC